MDNGNRVLCGSALILLALSLSPRRMSPQSCAASGSCDQEYASSGSDGNCSYDYAQLYCNGEYCDVTVETCEGSSSGSGSFSCSCY